MQYLGKILIITGIILVITGLIIWALASRLGWFGHLPGDIRIRRENFAFYFPITSMLLVSVGLSFIVWLIQKFLR